MARTDGDSWDLASSVGATATMVAGQRVLAHREQLIDDPYAEPLVRAVAIDLREDWVKALQDNGFDPSAPTAWIAEGLLIYLPPEAQDTLFDNITAISAPGSYLATEQVGDMSGFNDGRFAEMRERMRELGSTIEMTDLVYQGERTQPADYLESLGWDVTARTAEDAHADNDFELTADGMDRAFSDLRYVRAVLAQKR